VSRMAEKQRAIVKPTVGSLSLRMEQCRLPSNRTVDRNKTLNLSKPSRRSSTGSSRSSLSPDEEKPRLMSRQFSLQEPSNRLSKDVVDRIGNRQTKVVNQTKKCAACLKPLVDDGFFALGRLYHKSCFRCKYCKKLLSMKFCEKNGQACCGLCYKKQSTKGTCAECGNQVSDDHISFKTKLYHPHCMKCQVCGVLLREKYLVYKDHPICEKDYRGVGHVCTVCDEVIMDSVCTIEGVVMCEKDYKDLVSTWPCSACGQDISPDGHDALMVGDLRFHQACLECEVCHKNMEGKMITMDKENKVYCTEDYNKKYGIKCATCKKPIVPKKGQTKAPRIRALGKDFHLACFKCEDCGLLLDSGVKGKECWPIRSHTLCYRCYRRRQSESEQESEEE